MASSIAFYGNSERWLKTLNSDLKEDLITEGVLIPNAQEKEKEKELYPKIQNFITFDDNMLHFDVIIPMTEKDMIDLHTRLKNTENTNTPTGAIITMSNLLSIQTFMCKKKFYEYTIKNNLKIYIPTTYSCGGLCTDLNKGIPLNKTIVIKPYGLCSGQNIIVTKFKSKFDIKKISKNRIIQKYIKGDEEYCSYVIADEGKVKHIRTYKYSNNSNNSNNSNTTTPNKKGNYIKHAVTDEMIESSTLVDLSSTENTKKYIDVFEKFLIPCKYSGICNIDFKIHHDNIKIFEINARLGGSLMFPKRRKDLIFILSKMIHVGTKVPHSPLA